MRNHELWHECEHCGAEYDLRLWMGVCPECGHDYCEKLSL